MSIVPGDNVHPDDLLRNDVYGPVDAPSDTRGCSSYINKPNKRANSPASRPV